MVFIRRRGPTSSTSKSIGDLPAAAILVVLAIAFTGIPMLAIQIGIPLPKQSGSNDIGGYFLASVACVLIAVWFAGRAIVSGWRARRK